MKKKLHAFNRTEYARAEITQRDLQEDNEEDEGNWAAVGDIAISKFTNGFKISG